MELSRTIQCKKCPWKKSTNLSTIPDGYSCEMHAALWDTIAEPMSLKPTKAMACHESPIGQETYCIGYLVNQCGPGNNIPLRLTMLKYVNRHEIRTIGEQHETFQDTLPKNKNANQ